MKVLFWILGVVSVIVGLFLSFVCAFAHGLDLAGTAFGEVVCALGSATVLVCIVLLVLGIIWLCKMKNVKRALTFVLIALIFCALIFVGMGVDDVLHTKQMEKQNEEYRDQKYGDGWNDPPALEGIPEGYQFVLNEFYASLKAEFPGEELMDIGAVSMADYYGDAPLDNIGFCFMDVNGDGQDELLIGTMDSTEGTVIFCVYTDMENPFYAINSVEDDRYYMHPGESGTTFDFEMGGKDAAWIVIPAEEGDVFDFNYQDGAMDPANRMSLELTPFSQYK